MSAYPRMQAPQPSAPPPSYNQAAAIPPQQYPAQQSNIEKLRALTLRYEISDYFAMKLRQLESYDIVLLCDDSGSMNTPLQPTNTFSPTQSRWDELKQIVKVIVGVAVTLDRDGIDIFFMNRPAVTNITNDSMVDSLFQQPPGGLTPMVPALQQIIQHKQQSIVEKKLLIIIATDGQPTNAQGSPDVKSLRSWCQHTLRKDGKIHIQFVACTDDDQSVEYLNELDEKLPFVDVCDDYLNEKKEVLKSKGKSFKFSYGDYVCKILLGTVDPEFDNMDKKKDCTIQ